MNPSAFFAVAAGLALAAFPIAQDVPPNLALPAEAVSATLTPASMVLSAGQPIDLTLRAEFQSKLAVSATLLGGHYLETFLDGEASETSVVAMDGAVTVAAGTKLERTVRIDPARLWPAVDLAKHSVISFAWSGVPGATASIRVVPDQKDLNIDALDLAKTKVRFVTNRGDMVIAFLTDDSGELLAPRHVKNLVKLSASGFFNGTKFHRVVKGFMIQGGCPNTKDGADGMPGTGGPGWRVDAEFNDTKHVRGIVSMARAADPNSAGSQFFVLDGDAPHLDGSYSAFGKLDSGLDALDGIVATPVRRNAKGELSAPVEDIYLLAAIVELGQGNRP